MAPRPPAAAAKVGGGTTPEEGNRRAEIVRAAGRLFREKGYAATTIRDIAGAVGMRSGSPFYHFKSKHEILETVVSEGIAAILAEQDAALAAGRPLAETFETMIRIHLAHILGEGRDFAAALLYEGRSLEGESRARIVALKDRYESLWQKLLRRMKKAGLIADDSAAARLFLLGAMNWTVQWYSPVGRHDIPALARRLAALLIRQSK